MLFREIPSESGLPGSSDIGGCRLLASAQLLKVQFSLGPSHHRRVGPADPQIVQQVADPVPSGLFAGPAQHLVRDDEPLETIRRKIVGVEETGEISAALKAVADAELGDGVLPSLRADHHSCAFGEVSGKEPQQPPVTRGLDGTRAEQPDLIEDAFQHAGETGRPVGGHGARAALGRLPPCGGGHDPVHLLRRRVGGQEAAHFTQHGYGVVGLLVNPPGWEPLAQRINLGRVGPRGSARREQLRPDPVAIEERRAGDREGIARGGGDDSLMLSGLERPAHVHHRLRQGPVPFDGGPVLYGDLVVPIQRPVPELLIDPADAAHTERVELHGAKGAHAGGAEYMDAAFHDPHYFLVPYAWHPLEVAVHDADGARALFPQPVDISFAGVAGRRSR